MKKIIILILSIIVVTTYSQTTIYPTGRVGIGTTAPTSTLSIGTTGANALTIGTTANNVSIDAINAIRLTGSSTCFNDLFFPFTTGTNAGTGYPQLTADSGYYNFVVDTTGVTKCIMYFILQLPHNWKEGSTIYPHVHYKHLTGTGTPKFIIKYKWFNIGSATGSNFAWHKMEATTGTTNGTQQISYNSNNGISGNGKTLSSIIVFQLYLSDNPTNVLAYQFDVHYEIDSFGSNSETSKN